MLVFLRYQPAVGYSDVIAADMCTPRQLVVRTGDDVKSDKTEFTRLLVTREFWN